MKKKTILKIVSIAMGTVLTCGTFGILAGCGGSKPDALVIMSEELGGLFNPFFATSGADMSVVGQTQISMFTTNSDGEIAYGDEEAVVVKDYGKVHNDETDQTTYTFVLKNGLKFSDGEPLTINDVIFNMYVYLDQAYTGSTTMYSTKIDGLQRYRTQSAQSDDTNQDTELNNDATGRAEARIQAILNLYDDLATDYGVLSIRNAVTPAAMRNAIDAFTSFGTENDDSPTAIEPGYVSAIGAGTVAEARTQFREDYDRILELYEDELNQDFEGTKDAYWDTEPYKDCALFTGADKEIVGFMYAKGLVTVTYERDPNTGKEDRSRIKEARKNYTLQSNTKDAAVKYVFDRNIQNSLDDILNYFGTGNTIKTEFIAKAKDVILHERVGNSGLTYKNIRGVKALGLSKDETEGWNTENLKGTTINVNGHDYTIASDYNADGTVKNNNEYAVLQITINGVDPKAEWNFGFTVAPYHYYSDPTQNDLKMDIANNKFGVRWASFDFMKKVVQGTNSWGESKNAVPLGAGPYMASDRNYETTQPTAGGFSPSTSAAYYKSNPNFIMGEAKIKKMCYQVVSANNAIGQLENGSVHYIEPQYTDLNFTKLESMKRGGGYDYKSTWQLGYGYIGINAGKVTDINLRRAIMSAMDTGRVMSYYRANTASTIAWPMSIVNWAYPRNNGTSLNSKNYLDNMNNNNGWDYTQYNSGNVEAVKEKIKTYMRAAGIDPDNCEGDSRLKIKFTIAGTNVSEHPTYGTFLNARELLNDCGWDIEISPDTQALIKLSTGSLTVWAAAWGSTIDPDMYQVYHKNSSATSTLAWGYREILNDPSGRKEENDILTSLSGYIDRAREIENQGTHNSAFLEGTPDGRIGWYRKAMDKVLELAVELPCYQRQVIYAYNTDVIKSSSLPSTVNPYSSPLEKIWLVEFAD